MATAAVVSVSMGVMKPVLNKLATLMGDKYKKIKGLRKVVAFLQRELGDMDALLENMDRTDELDPQAKKWRRDIIEMSYNIEDRIDDFMLSIGEADNKMGFLRKAAKYLRTFKDRCRLADILQEIKTEVMEASESRKRYMFDQYISNNTPVVVDPRVSALHKDSSSLVGIGAQKDELVNWAMDGDKQLKFMAIVGLGGLGKTTLANEVFCQVKGQFNCSALVCVSQKPEITKLLKRILFTLGLQQYSHDYFEVQDLVDGLKKHLQDKRYFILVDDLWEIEAWDAIQDAFPQNNYCSRVMITTRNEMVAKRCCGTSGIIHNMKPLSEPDSRKLFFTRIFGSQSDCPSELEEVSCAILKRCGGLPLAIITISGILASQQTKLKEEWEYINTALAQELESKVDYKNMMYILDLSYKHLPRHIKSCFLYLGTYPEDHDIEKDELLRRWVAEGFVSNCAGLNVWDVAESYFNELVNRSMIQPSYDDYYPDVMVSCRVHDMMLELILRRCKEDNFLILVNDPHEVAPTGQDKVIRRLTMDLKGIDDDILAMTNANGDLSHLRSLTILLRGRSIWIPPLLESKFVQRSNWIPPLLESKFVRVLLLCWVFSGIDLFGIINQLRHLRYLKVDGAVPSGTAQIRGLLFLETLDLSGLDAHGPLDLVDLPRLSHLSVYCGTGLPRGIGEMKQLRTLRGVDLDQSSSESIVGLGELTALSELYLVFQLMPEVSWSKLAWMPSLYTSLEKLDKLRSLDVTNETFAFHMVAPSADGRRSLFPRSEGNLERLHLWDWTFSIVPRWIGHLRRLRELTLGAKQITQEDIGVIGILPSLVHLKLRIVRVLTTRIVIGAGLFIALKRFWIYCDGISSLAFEAGAMPNLGDLTLVFNAADWDSATPEGLQHLSSLQEITVHGGEGKKEAGAPRIKRVFQDIVVLRGSRECSADQESAPRIKRVLRGSRECSTDQESAPRKKRGWCSLLAQYFFFLDKGAAAPSLYEGLIGAGPGFEPRPASSSPKKLDHRATRASATRPVFTYTNLVICPIEGAV